MTRYGLVNSLLENKTYHTETLGLDRQLLAADKSSVSKWNHRR